MLPVSVLLLLSYAPRHLFAQPHRIIHGNISAPDSWPSMAALIYPMEDRGHSFCGGVVWDHLHILTAAHCTQNRSAEGFQVYLGHTNITRVNEDYTFKIEKIYAHPNYRHPDDLKPHDIYTYEHRIHDIAVLKLSRPIDFEDRHREVWCVCEPEPPEKLDTERCIILGWGNTEKNKQSLLLREGLVKAENCTPQCQLGPGKIMAADLEKKIDTCHGDSGGPMFCALKADAAVWSLVGLTSYGEPACSIGVVDKMSVYTRVWHYLDFIENITGPSPTIRPINSGCQLHCQQAFIIFVCALLRLAFG